jgi:hypothetical protein
VIRRRSSRGKLLLAISPLIGSSSSMGCRGSWRPYLQIQGLMQRLASCRGAPGRNTASGFSRRRHQPGTRLCCCRSTAVQCWVAWPPLPPSPLRLPPKLLTAMLPVCLLAP